MLDSVLVVEEHDGVRSALRDWLLTSFPPLRLREARSMEEALRLADQAQLDLILVNLELPGPNGIEATRALRKRHPDCPVVVMSMTDSEALRLAAVESLPTVGSNKLALRIGFHTGPVVQRDNDVFGDTVNVASRLADQAVRGQILTSQETAALLGGFIRNWTRPLYSIQIRGKAEEVAICEIVWRQSPDVTEAIGSSVARKPAPVTRRLQDHGQ